MAIRTNLYVNVKIACPPPNTVSCFGGLLGRIWSHPGSGLLNSVAKLLKKTSNVPVDHLVCSCYIENVFP
jgi:hypothetical protein